MERAQPGTVASSHLIKRMCASVFSYYHTENVTNRGYVSCTVPSLAPTEAPWWRCDGERHGSSSLIPLQAVRGLHLAHPELGPKPLLAKLREQQPDLAAGNKEVREALAALKAEESKPRRPPPPRRRRAPPAAEQRGAPPDVAISLACFGCARLPSEMGDGREKHPVCPICRELKIPTTYWCDVNCPGNPGAWKRHAPVHKAVRRQRERRRMAG